MATKSVFTTKSGAKVKTTSQAKAESLATKTANEKAPTGSRTPVRVSGGKTTITGPTVDFGDGTTTPTIKDTNGFGAEAPAGVAPATPAAPAIPTPAAPTMPQSAPAATAPVATPAAAATPVQSKYQQGLAAAQASGVPAPASAGQGRSGVAQYTPQPTDTSVADATLSDDPQINTLMQGITQLLNPAKQTSTLMQDYKSLYKQSGLDDINEELIDAETVINGTEDDIRNEIQTAGGFGTESQVQAMSLARNKGLLKRYNQLVQMKTDATNQLNTLSQLNAQDKQIAQQKIDSQINTMFNMANFRQLAVNNTKEQYRWLTTQMGADGLYNSLSKDPRQLANTEKILGLASGGLQSLAATAAAERARKMQADNLDIAAKQASINASNASTRKANLEIDALQNPTTDLSRAMGTIGDIGALASDSALSSSVGPNMFARFNLTNPFTGKKNNFIAGIEQLREQLTLDKLGEAKSSGATFGALSDGERQTVAAAATKIGSWAIKDASGKVIGYETSDSEFKKELDKINNFKKLDFLKKGGNPAQVGVVALPDGSYWTKDSNGVAVKIY